MFAIGSKHLGCRVPTGPTKTRPESRIKKFNAHLIYRPKIGSHRTPSVAVPDEVASAMTPTLTLPIPLPLPLTLTLTPPLPLTLSVGYTALLFVWVK